MAVFIAVAACATTGDRGGHALTGRWGGEQVELIFDETGNGRVTLPCAWATFVGPVTTDVGGHWMKPGSYTQGSGAPPPVPPTPVPANISGRLDSDGTLWLSVVTNDGMKVDNLTLRQDKPATLYFCP